MIVRGREQEKEAEKKKERDGQSEKSAELLTKMRDELIHPCDLK